MGGCIIINPMDNPNLSLAMKQLIKSGDMESGKTDEQKYMFLSWQYDTESKKLKKEI